MPSGKAPDGDDMEIKPEDEEESSESAHEDAPSEDLKEESNFDWEKYRKSKSSNFLSSV